MGLRARCQRKDGGLPRRHVEEEAAAQEIVAVPVVGGGSEQVLKTPILSGQLREGQADVALALVGGVIDGDDEEFRRRAAPGEHHEAIVSPVAFPSRGAFEKLPLSFAKGGPTQDGQEAVVEIAQLCIRRLR